MRGWRSGEESKPWIGLPVLISPPGQAAEALRPLVKWSQWSDEAIPVVPSARYWTLSIHMLEALCARPMLGINSFSTYFMSVFTTCQTLSNESILPSLMG